MLLFYIKSSLRSISRKKMFSGLNMAGLAIGICVFLLALEYYSFEKGFNRFHTNLSCLYRVNIHAQEGKSASSFPTIAPMMQQNIPGVHRAFRFGDNFNSGSIVAYQPVQNPSGARSFREEGCVFADAAFLDAFSFPMVEGSNQLDKTNTTVITASTAKKLFGHEKAVGKVLQFHNQFGTLPLSVTGVIADPPVQSDIKFDYLLSMEILNNPGYTTGSDWAKLDNWGNDAYTTYVWLDDGIDPNVVAAKASVLWKQNDPGYRKEKGSIGLQPVSEIHLGQGLKDDNPTYGSMAMTWLIMALGILVLCIAWINYINFSTAYAISQAKQIGIHKIVGSDKKQIVYRHIVEAALFNVFGLLLAIILVGLVQGLFNYLTGKPLSLKVVSSFSAGLYSAAIVLTGIVLCGGYVGWVLSGFKPVAMMRFNDAGHTGNALLRKGLVVFQFVISSVFIAATLIGYRQIEFMRHHELGMKIEKLVVVNGPAIRDSSYKTRTVLFKNELAQLSFVEKVSSTGSVPGLGSGHNYGADGITGSNARKGDDRKNYSISEVDEYYFDTYQVPFVSGSNFSREDANRSYKGDKLIVNETAARLLGYEPSASVGRLVNWGQTYKISGVVKDYHHRSLKEKIEPIIYVPQHNSACYTVQLRQDHLQEKMAAIRGLYEKMYPGNPFEYNVLKDAYDTQYADEERGGLVALSLSVLVIVISCLGLIGLSVFTARRRNKEMGIRKVLGASVPSLFALLSKEFLWLVAIAFVIAVPITLSVMDKWLEGFAYHIVISWWIFLVTGLVSLLITLMTVSFQALKTAFANPIKGLRSE